MDATVSLEHSLAQVLSALAQYEAVLRRNRGFPSDLDVVDAGEPGEVPDSGDRMKLNLEVSSSPLQTGHCEDAACGSSSYSYSSACELARFRTWTFPREKCKEPQETDPTGLYSFGQARAIKSGEGVSSDPQGLPFDTGRSVPIGHPIQLRGADVESVKDGKHGHPLSLSWTASRNVSSAIACSRDSDICRLFGHVRLSSSQMDGLLSHSTPTPCRRKTQP
ncbi:hypothetical protein B0H14DRAFT_2702852 [Mycena olivaceomarginata]|nr:hypothetical protein B0H14DRAFT_2702852 [Mycena olivaceomarginata]